MSNLTLLMYQSNTLNLVKKQENYYVDNRSMNRKEFIVHKGMDNIVYINITNQDRKKQNVYNNDIQADIIKYSTNEKVLTRYAVPGLNKGTAELKLSEEDMNSLVEGQYKVSFKNVAEDGTKTPIYSDYNNGILCTLIVKNDANPSPVATQIANVWSQTKNTDNGDASNVLWGQAKSENRRGRGPYWLCLLDPILGPFLDPLRVPLGRHHPTSPQPITSHITP